MDDVAAEVAKRLVVDPQDRQVLAEGLLEGFQYSAPYEQGETYLETIQNQQRSQALAREFAIADLNAMLEAEAPEGAWVGWNHLVREYPKECGRLTELFLRWEEIFPAQDFEEDLPIWERLEIYWPEHLPAEAGVLDAWELKTLDSAVYDVMERVVLGQLYARIAGARHQPWPTDLYQFEMDPAVTWQELMRGPEEGDSELEKIAWTWMSPASMKYLASHILRDYPDAYQNSPMPAPQWVWDWLEANPQEKIAPIIKEEALQQQQEWVEAKANGWI